jgi:hypothetical protein
LSSGPGWLEARLCDLLPLALIPYLPATISFVLTNMRCTITQQPLLLIFVGVAVEAALRRTKSMIPDRCRRNVARVRHAGDAVARGGDDVVDEVSDVGSGTRPRGSTKRKVCAIRNDAVDRDRLVDQDDAAGRGAINAVR